MGLSRSSRVVCVFLLLVLSHSASGEGRPEEPSRKTLNVSAPLKHNKQSSSVKTKNPEHSEKKDKPSTFDDSPDLGNLEVFTLEEGESGENMVTEYAVCKSAGPCMNSRLACPSNCWYGDGYGYGYGRGPYGRGYGWRGGYGRGPGYPHGYGWRGRYGRRRGRDGYGGGGGWYGGGYYNACKYDCKSSCLASCRS